MTDIGTFTKPKTKWYPSYHENNDFLNLKFRKRTVWL